jgi:uncharacterized damage-inducible protein DinB
MNFELSKSVEILERTPHVIEQLLSGLSDEWTTNNEGGETWSPYDVVGHLIHGECTDWIQRLEIILSVNGDKKFAQFDRFAQFEESKGKTIAQLLEEFKTVRKKNIQFLRSKNISEEQLNMTGIHPKFGSVTLRQLLSTWAVHDMAHLAQIARVIAKQYKSEVGPWVEYMSILADRSVDAK